MNERPAGENPGANATEIRALLRRSRCGALATALAADDGRPYVSLVTAGWDHDLSPILLLSQLADHTRNLLREPRACLLIEEASRNANPQTGPRVSLAGRILADGQPRLRRRFLARHPGAAVYADFADFSVFRMAVERAHYVGGFGRAAWIEATALAPAGDIAAIAAAEVEVIAEINEQYPAAIDAMIARRLQNAGSGWQVAGIDPDGCDLQRHGVVARIAFAEPAVDSASLRQQLLALIGPPTGRGASDPP